MLELQQEEGKITLLLHSFAVIPKFKTNRAAGTGNGENKCCIASSSYKCFNTCRTCDDRITAVLRNRKKPQLSDLFPLYIITGSYMYVHLLYNVFECKYESVSHGSRAGLIFYQLTVSLNEYFLGTRKITLLVVYYMATFLT